MELSESLRASAAASARARMSVALDASYRRTRHASSPGTATSPNPAAPRHHQFVWSHALTSSTVFIRSDGRRASKLIGCATDILYRFHPRTSFKER